MPRVRRGRTKFPEGWDLIEETLEEMNKKMRDAEMEGHEGKRKVEALWPIFRLHHQRSRYIYELFYKSKTISRQLYDFCLREKYADAALIAKWRKEGYENLCCLRCIQPRDTNYNSTCICRVPRKDVNTSDRGFVECQNCGCHGCATGDS